MTKCKKHTSVCFLFLRGEPFRPLAPSLPLTGREIPFSSVFRFIGDCLRLFCPPFSREKRKAPKGAFISACGRLCIHRGTDKRGSLSDCRRRSAKARPRPKAYRRNRHRSLHQRRGEYRSHSSLLAASFPSQSPLTAPRYRRGRAFFYFSTVTTEMQEKKSRRRLTNAALWGIIRVEKTERIGVCLLVAYAFRSLTVSLLRF